MMFLGIVAATMSLAPQQFTGPELAVIARKAALAAVEKYKDKKVAEEQLGVAIVALNRGGKNEAGSFRGDQKMYPASVVKLFYLAAAADQLERKKLKLTPEVERGIRDMIVESTNDATALILEMLTGTTGGPELPEGELKKWMDKRQAVNRWYASMGYQNINACQKTWNEGPYGRERQGYGPKFELRNMLTPDACARLMSEIASDKIVSPEKGAWMRGYLSRKIVADGEKADYQSSAFIGRVLPKGTKLWSKAGWTDTVAHDVVYIVAPDGREFVIAVFTKDHSDIQELVSFVGSEVLRSLGILPRPS
jgi:beta-lactamase class A